MKKLSLLVLILSLFTVSCSHDAKDQKKEVKEVATGLEDLPSWVVNPEVEGGVAAVGMASPSKGGLRFQIARAESDAKANIASAIQTEISRVTKEALREARVNDVNDVDEAFSQATKEVVKNMPLSGVTRIAMAKGKDGTLYIHMMLKNKDFSSYFQNTQKVYESRLKAANLSRDNINKSQEAVKDLFEELEKERGIDGEK